MNEADTELLRRFWFLNGYGGLIEAYLASARRVNTTEDFHKG